MPRLLDTLALSTGSPDPRLPHPTAQRLPRNFEIMKLCQLLGRECRSKVCVALPYQSDRMIATHIGQAVVRGTTATLVGDGGSTAIPIPSQQPIRLPWRYRHQLSSCSSRQSVAVQPRQNIKTVQLALAHHHHSDLK